MLRFSMRKGPRMFDVSGCPGGLRVPVIASDWRL